MEKQVAYDEDERVAQSFSVAITLLDDSLCRCLKQRAKSTYYGEPGSRSTAQAECEEEAISLCNCYYWWYGYPEWWRGGLWTAM